LYSFPSLTALLVNVLSCLLNFLFQLQTIAVYSHTNFISVKYCQVVPSAIHRRRRTHIVTCKVGIYYTLHK
jgi:hypothetical protein